MSSECYVELYFICRQWANTFWLFSLTYCYAGTGGGTEWQHGVSPPPVSWRPPPASYCQAWIRRHDRSWLLLLFTQTTSLLRLLCNNKPLVFSGQSGFGRCVRLWSALIQIVENEWHQKPYSIEVFIPVYRSAAPPPEQHFTRLQLPFSIQFLTKLNGISQQLALCKFSILKLFKFVSLAECSVQLEHWMRCAADLRIRIDCFRVCILGSKHHW